MELLTNNKKTDEGEVDIPTPAFSLTKVQATLGAFVTAVLAVLPASLKSNEAIVIAAIAAGTLVLLGVFALAAVDIQTRQRAREAALRFGGGKAAAADFVAVPGSEEDLVLQVGHNTDEYEVKLATVKDGEVTLVATRDGRSISQVFQEPTKPK